MVCTSLSVFWSQTLDELFIEICFIVKFASSSYRCFLAQTLYFEKNTGNASQILTAIRKDMISNLCTFRHFLIADTNIQ